MKRLGLFFEDEDTAEVSSPGVPQGEADKQSAVLNQAFSCTHFSRFKWNNLLCVTS